MHSPPFGFVRTGANPERDAEERDALVNEVDGRGYRYVAVDRREIWRAFTLAPHRSQTFKLSTDPLFIDKARDVVGLYMEPPEEARVLCVDEKSQIQALDRSCR